MTYRRIAVSVAGKINEYIRLGFAVKGIIGVDGSPSCGVNERLNLRKSFCLLSGISPDRLDRADFNRELYTRCLEPGNGIFIEELKKQLRRLKLEISFDAHSLISEMNVNTSLVSLEKETGG